MPSSLFASPPEEWTCGDNRKAGGGEPKPSPVVRKRPYSKLCGATTDSHMVASNACPESIGVDPGF